MAVEVRAVSGRVAAAARVVVGKGKGTDWLPMAAEPATKVVVPGVPGGGGRRELYVTAPGEVDTVVRVKALTADGFYAMKNREVLEVPAGSTASVDLSTGMAGQPSALVLSADVPIVAGLMITGTGTQQDVAFGAGAVPIDIGSVVADNRSGKKVSSRLDPLGARHGREGERPDAAARGRGARAGRGGDPRRPHQGDQAGPAGRQGQSCSVVVMVPHCRVRGRSMAGG